MHFIKLGYGVYGHNVGVHRVMVDLFKVYYDDQYFWYVGCLPQNLY